MNLLLPKPAFTFIMILCIFGALLLPRQVQINLPWQQKLDIRYLVGQLFKTKFKQTSFKAEMFFNIYRRFSLCLLAVFIYHLFLISPL